MARIIYIEHDGTEHPIEVGTGLSLMQGAVQNGVPGILADCGGSCACATCHVYIAENGDRSLGQPGPMEQSMLECASHVGPGSRLSCQIIVSAVLDGLVVRLPPSQGE